MTPDLDKQLKEWGINHPVPADYATIISHVTYTTDETRSVSFEWRGPENGTLWVSYELIRLNPDWQNELPWKLIQIGNDDSKEIAYFKREEFVKS
jgi:hypothetical protein